MKKFLILQLRADDEVADNEFHAMLRMGGLTEDEVHRVRIEHNGIPDDINPQDYAGIIVGGGPTCVSTPKEDQSPEQLKFDADLFKLSDVVYAHDIPYMGACYGIGILAAHQGACVSKEKYSEEVGPTHVYKTEAGAQDILLRDLPDDFYALCGHQEACQEVPESATLLLTSDVCPVQMFRIKENIYATQFHPELDYESICLRIDFYKHAGYFKSEDAEHVKAHCATQDIVYPAHILKAFVSRYRTH